MPLRLVVPVASFALGIVSTSIVWFYFKPLSEVKSVISQTDADLQYYAHVITSPGAENHDQTTLDEASESLRIDAAQLRAASNQVPKYRTVRRVAGLPSRGSVDTAARKLTGLSNTVYDENQARNREWKAEIEDELGFS